MIGGDRPEKLLYQERISVMENLFTGVTTIPVYQIMFLLIILTVCLLFGYLKLGIFLCYVFVFYWGNIFNIRSIFGNADATDAGVSFLVVGFGLIIVFLAMLGFLLNKE
jgi:hypothetical protein